MSALPTRIKYFLLGSALLTYWLGFLTTSTRLEKIRKPEVSAEMQVILPRGIQVALAGGDRFLAANIDTFRTLTADPQNQRADRFVIQALVQEDAAWLNPRHEDNYYLAAANLAWNEQLDAAQRILEAASKNAPIRHAAAVLLCLQRILL